jgi:hypothetical protein
MSNYAYQDGITLVLIFSYTDTQPGEVIYQIKEASYMKNSLICVFKFQNFPFYEK